MQAPVEIFRVIEEQFMSYGERRWKELTSPSALTDAALHTARGKAIATQDLLRVLRDTLGYDLDSWFDDDEEDEGQSAESAEEPEAESSTVEASEDSDPDEEVPVTDAPEGALEAGTSIDTTKDEADPYSWVSELDPNFRSKVEALVQSDRSQKGRVAALQRQLDSEHARKEAQARAQTSDAAPEAVPDASKIEDMSDEELDAFLEEYPTVARNVEKLIERRVSQEREDILGQVRPMQEAALQERIAANKAALRKEAEYIFNSEETGIYLDDVLSSRAFLDWVQEQPIEYQEFAKRAESVEAASKVLSDFAMYADQMVAAQYPDEEPAATTSRTDTADQTAARRKQAKQGTAPKSKSANIRDDLEGDYEALFNSFVDAG